MHRSSSSDTGMLEQSKIQDGELHDSSIRWSIMVVLNRIFCSVSKEGAIVL